MVNLNATDGQVCSGMGTMIEESVMSKEKGTEADNAAMSENKSVESPVKENKKAPPHERAEPPRKLILIVDDVLVMRLRLRSQIEGSGFRVLEAEDGEKALAILEKEHNIHLIITDVSMPVMDGLEFIRRLRILPRFSTVPVIICTVKGELSVVRQAKQLGVQGFLVKPVAKSILINAIKREIG